MARRSLYEDLARSPADGILSRAAYEVTHVDLAEDRAPIPWTGLSVGIAASALLFAACADESPVRSDEALHPGRGRPAIRAPRRRAASIHRSMPHMLRSDGGCRVQAADPAASAPPAISDPDFIGPPAPPTAVELADAWKEGVALYDSGDYSGAIVPLQIAADGLPDEPYTQYLFGLSLWKVGEFDSAERALRTASDLNPDSLKTWINLARVRLDNDDAQGALTAADAALALDARLGRCPAPARAGPRRPETQRRRAGDAGAGPPARSRQWIRRQYARLPAAAKRPGRRCTFLISKRRATACRKIAYVRNNLGVAYERSGDMVRAVDEYRAAVEAGDSGGKALASIGRLQPDRR